jgi:hypothetical protein
MVIAAMAVPDGQGSSGSVLSAEQHFPSKVTGGSRPGKPQKARCSHFTPEEPVGRYSQTAVLGLAACAGLALYATAALARLEVIRARLAVFSSAYGRMCVMSFMPCLGLIAMWATIANNQGNIWSHDHIVQTLVAFIVPCALLMRLLDTSRGAPLKL